MSTQGHRLESNELSEIFNNPVAQDIRLAMLKGEWHSACSQCKAREDRGMTSDRGMYEQWYNNAVKTDVIDPDGPRDVIMPTIKWADLRPSNLCNLKCRMCFPDNSTEVAREWAKFTTQELEVVDNDYSSKQLNQLSQRKHYKLPELNDVVNLKLLGGEPTVQSEVFDILDTMNYNEHSKIDITTNATSVQQFKAIEPRLKQFAQVNWSVSIDGYEDSFEYVRTPARWDRFSGAVEHLCSTAWARLNTSVEFHYTLQAWNWHSIPQVYEYSDRLGSEYDNFRGMYLQQVDQPWLGLAVIPLEHRTSVLATLEKKGLDRREETFKWSQSTPFDSTLVPKFIEHTAILDRTRGTLFKQLNPELYESLLQYV
jgi:sulfatase maturation enzyme AslB (radical SAM superfamily)